MSKHSAGTWYYDETDGHVRSADALGDKPGHGRICDPHVDGMSVEEREANARLIAAAPALLEACRAVVADYDAADEVKYDENKWADFKGVDPLRAVIAAIEGQ